VSGPIRLERRDSGVVLLTLALPEQRNAMTAELTAAWVAAINELRGDRSVRALVVTGEYPVTVLLRTRADGSIDEAFGRHRVWDDTSPDAGELRVDLWIDIALAELS